MEKKTFVPERKAYLAPAAKSHIIDLDGTVLAGEASGFSVYGTETMTVEEDEDF